MNFPTPKWTGWQNCMARVEDIAVCSLWPELNDGFMYSKDVQDLLVAYRLTCHVSFCAMSLLTLNFFFHCLFRLAISHSCSIRWCYAHIYVSHFWWDYRLLLLRPELLQVASSSYITRPLQKHSTHYCHRRAFHWP